MYRADMSPECESEEEYAAIMTVVSYMLDCDDKSSEGIIVKKLKRTVINVPNWGGISRHERFSNKI